MGGFRPFPGVEEQKNGRSSAEKRPSFQLFCLITGS
jgi:hypothetical protein